MNQNIKMILFVIVLGLFTSGILVGMDALTRDRIEANKNYDNQSTVLIANGYANQFTAANINDFFNEKIETVVLDGYTFYVGKDTQRISFRFVGGGVWGDIIGIITFESDFVTIVSITILEQEETPGLGGVVAEAPYLAQFVGKTFDQASIKRYPAPNTDIALFIEINKDDNQVNLPNEIDSIVGATRTSKAFEFILNTNYAAHLAAWNAR